ncbi:MAG: GspE/PulE family protein, partial [Chroococcales cyanobacterium]
EITELSIEQLVQLIETLLPLKNCRDHRILPISLTEGDSPVLSVAMVDPDDLVAVDDLKKILLKKILKGMSIRRLVITPEDYHSLLNQYADEKVKEEEARRRKEAEDSLILDPKLFGEGETELLGDVPDDPDLVLDPTKHANDAPIVNTVNKILAKALSDGVSDIHVEPQEEFLRVRMRKDGVLHEFARLPSQVTNALTSRFKIISDMDIAERRNAQDGRIRRIFQGRTVDFRVNCLPSRYGEKLCLRILDNSSTQLGLDKLISNPDSLALVREMASRPFGLILVTGPTGSGKSTSLYSVLAERNDPAVNISTAEDPIEYALPGITQCQVIRAKGLDFTNLLRAFMRQDPDIILVGETRDKETAKTAIEAALTGHLVLTTLHTNDAAGAIARLDEMGVEP